MEDSIAMRGDLGAPSAHVCVVIPAYKAERTIAAVLAGIPPWVRSIVVVDDASEDATSAAVREAADPRVVLLRHEVNGGVGAAMVSGYRAALELGADILVKMDADLQMDPAELPRLLEPIRAGRADYTKGNRFYSEAMIADMPALRVFGNAVLSFVAKLSSGAWNVFDPNNGYTAIHADLLRRIDPRHLHPRFFFESSVLVVATVARAVIEDVPMAARYGDAGSHLSVAKTLLQFPLLHLRAALWRFRQRYLIHDFNAVSLLVLVGLPLFSFGVIDGALLWIQANRTMTLTPTGTIMISMLSTILGFQMLLHALLLDVSGGPRQPLQGLARFGPDLWSRARRG